MKITISGNSMYPFLKNNDEVTVDQTYTLQIGRIYVFLDEDKKLICHRLIGEHTFKGDNSLLSERVEREKIIGMVSARNDKLINYKTAKALTYLSKLNSKAHWGVTRRMARALLLIVAS
ncbi:MAG: hypothetical protein CME71_10220 [Halobacteriovorax sp.]|nr:hypothetical protein [Halobacteriovorax sp.]|tara:strand:- start:463 stop:819 length:357 start_codon:yes stop_codon:yes gene_type:complete